MTRLDDYLARSRRAHGDRLDTSSLAPAFVPYFNSHDRVRVRFPYGEELTGTIGVTGGWRPAFLLMRRSSDLGSSYILNASDVVTAVKRGDRYVPVDEH